MITASPCSTRAPSWCPRPLRPAKGPASLARLPKALLVGYEVTCRLGEVFRGSQFYHGIHPTALCGVFGPPPPPRRSPKPCRDALVRALGIAGTQASGLTEWRADGSWIKRLHPGRAAQSGVLAARLAGEGFTGPATIFEGDGGFFNAFSYGERIEPECMTRDLGERHAALETALKPYPCCRFEHGAIDLALDARAAGIAAAGYRGRGHPHIPYRRALLSPGAAATPSMPSSTSLMLSRSRS